jgi:hypothetical protein
MPHKYTNIPIAVTPESCVNLTVIYYFQDTQHAPLDGKPINKAHQPGHAGRKSASDGYLNL